MHGLLCEARKLTHGAYLRRDPVMSELIGVQTVDSHIKHIYEKMAVRSSAEAVAHYVRSKP